MNFGSWGEPITDRFLTNKQRETEGYNGNSETFLHLNRINIFFYFLFAEKGRCAVRIKSCSGFPHQTWALLLKICSSASFLFPYFTVLLLLWPSICQRCSHTSYIQPPPPHSLTFFRRSSDFYPSNLVYYKFSNFHCCTFCPEWNQEWTRSDVYSSRIIGWSYRRISLVFPLVDRRRCCSLTFGEGWTVLYREKQTLDKRDVWRT